MRKSRLRQLRKFVKAKQSLEEEEQKSHRSGLCDYKIAFTVGVGMRESYCI